MTKFWMVVAAILFGLTTGCPDGDDDADALCIPACAPGYVCLYGDCAPEGSDTDADADSDTTEDDADTSETVDCPNVAGDWALTYRNTETGAEDHLWLTLEQDGCLVIGVDEVSCEWSGTISGSGYLSVFVDCYTIDRTVTGTFTQPPPHGRGMVPHRRNIGHMVGRSPVTTDPANFPKRRTRGVTFFIAKFYYLNPSVQLSLFPQNLSIDTYHLRP